MRGPEVGDTVVRGEIYEITAEVLQLIENSGTEYVEYEIKTVDGVPVEDAGISKTGKMNGCLTELWFCRMWDYAEADTRSDSDEGGESE
jgi:hypothetical protein